MTDFNIKKFYEDQVEWYKKQIGWNTKEIEWLTKCMNEEREEFKRLREYVWSKGPLTETEMGIWGTDECKTTDFKKYKAQRRREYLRRKRNTATMMNYQKKLEAM